jgi:hypothetical protein
MQSVPITTNAVCSNSAHDKTLYVINIVDDRRVSWYVNTCAVGVYILPVSTIFRFGFGSFLTEYYFFVFCLFVYLFVVVVFCFLLN